MQAHSSEYPPRGDAIDQCRVGEMQRQAMHAPPRRPGTEDSPINRPSDSCDGAIRKVPGAQGLDKTRDHPLGQELLPVRVSDDMQVPEVIAEERSCKPTHVQRSEE